MGRLVELVWASVYGTAALVRLVGQADGRIEQSCLQTLSPQVRAGLAGPGRGHDILTCTGCPCACAASTRLWSLTTMPSALKGQVSAGDLMPLQKALLTCACVCVAVSPAPARRFPLRLPFLTRAREEHPMTAARSTLSEAKGALLNLSLRHVKVRRAFRLPRSWDRIRV